MRPIRVLHCPWNIAGNAGGLSRAERALGVESRLITLRPEPFGYPADETLTVAGASSLMVETARLRLLWRAINWADVIHFNFGQSLLMPGTAPDVTGGFRHSIGRGLWQIYARLVFMSDLPLLRAFGKRIAVTFQGDDARQACVAQRFMKWGLEADYYSEHSDAWKRRIIGNFARHADTIYTLNIDLPPLLPPRARFLPYSALDPAETKVIGVPGNRVPVIVHAPSHRGIKGTRYLLEALQQLRGEGIAFELDLIENLPNKEARQRYERADLVVDQLIVGWYGGIGVEVMALGKPLITYIHDEDASHVVPSEMLAELPVIRADPSNIADVLRTWLGPRRADLPDIGMRGRRYIERWHDPYQIARIVIDDYARMLGRPA